MKATFNGNKYRSQKGNLVFVYKVTGTSKEIADYVAAQAKSQNKAEKDIARDEQGNPLFFFVPDVRNGKIAEKQLSLTVGFKGGIFVDDTAKEMNEQAEDRLMFRQERAKLWAQADVNGNGRVATVAAPARTQANQDADIFNAGEILNGAGAEEGAESNEPTLAQLATEGAGTGTLQND